MKKFGVVDIVLIVLIVAGIAANVFVYGFYNKDGSGGGPDASGRPVVTTESRPGAGNSPATGGNTPTPGAGNSPTPSGNTPTPGAGNSPTPSGNTPTPGVGNSPTPEPQEAVVNTLVFRINSPNVTVNGQVTAIDELGSAPYSQDGVSMLPLRAIYEILGGAIEYDAGTRYITATFLDTSLKVKTGETGAEVNGRFATLPVAPVAKDGTTYVPARSVTDALRAELSWDGETQSITLMIPSESVINAAALHPR